MDGQCHKSCSKVMKMYNEETRKGYFFEVDVQYPEILHDLYNDLPFSLKI